MGLTLIFGSDHAGFRLRERVRAYAQELGYETEVFGAESEESYDYPFAADAVAQRMRELPDSVGILVCGSGIGVDIRANRYSHVRAANCLTPEMAELARAHNHANVLCLGARLVEWEEAQQIFDRFLNSEPDRNERHVRRVEELGANT